MTRNAKKTTVTTDRILSSLQIHVVTGSCRTSQKNGPWRLMRQSWRHLPCISYAVWC